MLEVEKTRNCTKFLLGELFYFKISVLAGKQFLALLTVFRYRCAYTFCVPSLPAIQDLMASDRLQHHKTRTYLSEVGSLFNFADQLTI